MKYTKEFKQLVLDTVAKIGRIPAWKQFKNDLYHTTFCRWTDPRYVEENKIVCREYYKKKGQTKEYKEKKRIYDQKWMKSERGVTYRKNYFETNKAFLQRQAWELRNQNREYYLLKDRTWYANNKWWIRPKRNEEYKCSRFKKMVNFIRGSVYRAIKAGGLVKINHAWEYVGCTPEFLIAYLEPMFLPGMTWENYGKLWHVDHKIAVDTIKEGDMEQFRKVCHYTNLRPLWIPDNLSKGSKTEEEFIQYKIAKLKYSII